MEAADGTFNDSTEVVQALGIEIGMMELGAHYAFVRVRDSNNQWSDASGGEFLVVAPPSPAIVINEILQAPDAVDDEDGEWIELYNNSGDTISLAGYVLKDADDDSIYISFGEILPYSYFVLGCNGNPSQNGGYQPDFVYDWDDFYLSNSSDEVILSLGATVVDCVAYDNGATFPDPTGASMELINPGLDNALGMHWLTAVESFGDGDLGTPGTENSRYADIPTPVTLTIAKSGNDIVLNWNMSFGAVEYIIFRGIQPYFIPGAAAAIDTLEAVVFTFTDTNALISGQKYFYNVKGNIPQNVLLTSNFPPPIVVKKTDKSRIITSQ